MRAYGPEPLGSRAGYVLAVVVTAAGTLVCALMASHVDLANLVMVYLLGVTFVATRTKPGPAILASFLSVAAFDFCFVHPSGTFAVADIQYVFTFGVMFVVSLLISTLTVRLREQSHAHSEATLSARVEQLRSDLLSTVSHDLRTPLASIEGSADALLAQPELGEQSRLLASTIQDESLRMARLIRNLLDMTRVQGHLDLDLDWQSLDELAANAILRTANLFDRPVSLDVPPELPLVKVDGVLIEQVFVNFLENASRHAGRAAAVFVQLRREGDEVVARVTDDGPGITPGAEERIFERFQGTKGAGVGLGLAICRAAIVAHGGRIWARNLPTRGAEFGFALPVGDEGEAPR